MGYFIIALFPRAGKSVSATCNLASMKTLHPDLTQLKSLMGINIGLYNLCFLSLYANKSQSFPIDKFLGFEKLNL